MAEEEGSQAKLVCIAGSRGRCTEEANMTRLGLACILSILHDEFDQVLEMKGSQDRKEWDR